MGFLFDEPLNCRVEVRSGLSREDLGGYLGLIARDLTVNEDSGTTVLYGVLVDQAALLGLINTLYTMNAVILALDCTIANAAIEQPWAGRTVGARQRGEGIRPGPNQQGKSNPMSEASKETGKILPSWADGAARSAIVAFVERVTTEGSPDYVEPAARVATFDNDGTLWCEKPMPVEVDFILRRLAAMAEIDDSLRGVQPWQAAYEKDYSWLGRTIEEHYKGDDTNVKVLMGGILKVFEGLSVEDYQAAAAEFFDNATNPHLELPYTGTAYVPMVELLQFLETNGFTTYIASGGDRDFMRLISEALYGIPMERVIGSSNALTYQSAPDGGTVVYLAQPDVFDDGPIKPVRIWSRTGRRPILAGGNSNGDIPMLEYASHSSRPSLSLLVNHDDPDGVDPAYSAGAEKALELAAARGWTVISVKEDWKQVF